MSAIELLEKAAGHLKDRAVTYDKPAGERSIGAVVRAFNAVTGDGLMNTGERGWLFMAILKMVRSQQGNYRADNYEDGAAYFALMGEAACEERNGGWTDGEIKAAAFKDACDSAESDWPDESRIDAIGQNGNDGQHYRTLALPEDVIIPESAHFIVVYENGQMVAHDLKPVLVQGCWQAAAGNQYIGLGDGSQAGLYERTPEDVWVGRWSAPTNLC